MQRLQTPGQVPGGAVAYNAAVGFENGRQLPHGSRREYLVGGIQLGQGQVALDGRYALFVADIEHHLPRQSGEAGVGMWRADRSASHHEQVRVVGLRHEAVQVEHDRAVDARYVCLYRSEYVVEEVVVMDLGVET